MTASSLYQQPNTRERQLELSRQEAQILESINNTDGLRNYYTFIEDVLSKLHGLAHVKAECDPIKPIKHYIDMLDQTEAFDESTLLQLIFNLPAFHYHFYAIEDGVLSEWEPTKISFNEWFNSLSSEEVITSPRNDVKALCKTLYNWMLSLCSNDLVKVQNQVQDLSSSRLRH